MAEDLRICEPGSGGGLVLPLGGEGEQDWPRAVRIILYLIGLAWFFMGVAIISDVFMGAIEKITSRRVTKQNYGGRQGRNHTEPVWNPTVANLTLMALGSSAPEILLNVIELFANEFETGKLGPSTIVGSAAFNLLCIVAVCVVAIPAGEKRRIKEVPVYVVTTTFSMFAYLWMVFVLLVNSKDEVEVWEGLVTFFMFPVLVGIAYLADLGYFTKTKPMMGQQKRLGATTHEELAELEAGIKKQYDGNITDEQVSKILEATAMPTSRAAYRVMATRLMTGGRRITMPRPVGRLSYRFVAQVQTSLTRRSRSKVMPVEEEEATSEDPSGGTGVPVVSFELPRYAVLENAGEVKLKVLRSGNLNKRASVQFQTRDGTAMSNQTANQRGIPHPDYDHVEGVLSFEPNETEKTISVHIVDDNAYEEDEEFYVDLAKDPHDTTTVLGKHAKATVTIIDDDEAGVLGFPSDTKEVQEEAQDFMAEITIDRRHGANNDVSCSYHTEDATAVAGIDYDACSGEVVFGATQSAATICINIKAVGKYDKKMFRVILTNPQGGAKFDEQSDGGAESCILCVYITSAPGTKERIDNYYRKISERLERAKLGHNNWREQFVEALYVNGGEDGDDEGGPTVMDYVMHAIMVPWKVAFALVPPTDYCGGWACFVCSLLMIGVVTAVVGDMAGLLGCVLDVPDEVTAITFVALGTSLPDTFASKTAAVQDPYADASVGNVTGSNSVNVFLGLGMPWTIGSLYWAVQGKTFQVESGSLVSSVIVYCCCALGCITILAIRRAVYGAELGGPQITQYITAGLLVCLWVLYVVLSSIFTLNEGDR